MKEIPLTKGYIALVDDADYTWLSRWRWCAYSGKDGHVYAGRMAGILMHRVVINAPKGKHVDHIDGNGCNNQRSNLRLASSHQNQSNRQKHKVRSSHFKGVHRGIYDKKWRACIRVNRKLIHLGCFGLEIDAAKAYDTAALEHFGEFACLNFPTAARGTSA